MARSDRELIEAAKVGDTQAMEELLARHERQVYRFGLRMCGSEEEAREVLQQTLLAAFQGLTSFRGEAELSTWLYQVARSYCLRSRRQRAGAPSELLSLESPTAEAVPAEAAGPDAVAQARQMAEVLQAAILALPERYREALILRDVEGLSAEEAARVVDVEVGALKSRLHRARMELRKHLETLLGEGTQGQGPECPELAESLTAYSAEEIDQSLCARIEEHLSRCERCAGACESLKRTVSLCRHLPNNEVPAPVRAALRRALSQLVPA